MSGLHDALAELLERELADRAEADARSARAGVRCTDCGLRYDLRQDYGCHEEGRGHAYDEDELDEAAERARREPREYVTLSVAEVRALLAETPPADLPVATGDAGTEDEHEHEWTRCEKCPHDDEPCPCSGERCPACPATSAAGSSPEEARPACDTCGDSGRVPHMSEGDPHGYIERDDDGMIPCPDCDVTASPEDAGEAPAHPKFELLKVRHLENPAIRAAYEQIKERRDAEDGLSAVNVMGTWLGLTDEQAAKVPSLQPSPAADEGGTLTEAEIATHTYMAVEGPMFNAQAVERILAGRLAAVEQELERLADVEAAHGGVLVDLANATDEAAALQEQLAVLSALCQNARRHSGGSHTAQVDVLSIERALADPALVLARQYRVVTAPGQEVGAGPWDTVEETRDTVRDWVRDGIATYVESRWVGPWARHAEPDQAGGAR